MVVWLKLKKYKLLSSQEGLMLILKIRKILLTAKGL